MASIFAETAYRVLGADDHDDGSSHSSHFEQQIVLCFMFFGLFLGAITTWLLSRFAPGLPYTVVLFILGIMLAQFNNHTDLHVFGESISTWEHIDPHLLLYVFLPALLFGEAMSLNIHDVKLCIPSALCLAGPGAVYGTMVMGVLSFYILDYGWSWKLCCTFGAILAATDPVAVVAVLKEVGATPRITMLVTLEALMNDGAALVLYNLFFTSLLKEGDDKYDSASAIAVYFIKVIFISPILGLVMGLATCGLFALANNRTNHGDMIIQKSLTLCTAYLSFFVAEYVLEVSGVICCCTAGGVIAWMGAPLILQHESMHSVWGTFEWIGNTLIFLLAGLLFGVDVLDDITGTDVGFVFVIYLLLHVVRGFMLFCAYPVLSRGVYGLIPAECVFLTWGGLRGAVGMALALALVHNADSETINVSKEDAHKLFFIVGGVAALTLLVNATTAAWMLNKLGLVEEMNDAIKTMQHYARKRIYKSIIQLVVNLKQELPAFDEHIVAALIQKSEEQLGFGKPIHNKAPEAVGEPVAAAPKRRQRRSSLGSANVKSVTLGTGDKMSTLEEATAGYKPYALHKNATLLDHYKHHGEDGVDAPPGKGAGAPMPFIADFGLDKSKQRQHKSSSSLDTTMVQVKRSNSNIKLILKNLGVASDSTKEKQAAPYRGLVARGSVAANLNTQQEKVSMEDIDRSASSLANLLNNFSLNDGKSKGNGIKSGSVKVKRGADVDESLLEHVRIAFLAVLRSTYWKHVESGKLPRRSSVAILLLNSVDFARDFVDNPGCNDWEFMESSLAGPPLWATTMATTVDVITGSFSHALSLMGIVRESHYCATAIHDALVKHHTGHKIHILASYIEAHQCASATIPYYLGEEETSVDTPEEAIVLKESAANIKLAQDMLAAIDHDEISHHVAHQITKIITRTKENLILEFQESGVIRPVDAEVLLEEAHEHLQHSHNEWLSSLWRKAQPENENKMKGQLNVGEGGKIELMETGSTAGVLATTSSAGAGATYTKI